MHRTLRLGLRCARLGVHMHPRAVEHAFVVALGTNEVGGAAVTAVDALEVGAAVHAAQRPVAGGRRKVQPPGFPRRARAAGVAHECGRDVQTPAGQGGVGGGHLQRGDAQARLTDGEVGRGRLGLGMGQCFKLVGADQNTGRFRQSAARPAPHAELRKPPRHAAITKIRYAPPLGQLPKKHVGAHGDRLGSVHVPKIRKPVGGTPNPVAEAVAVFPQLALGEIQFFVGRQNAVGDRTRGDQRFVRAARVVNPFERTKPVRRVAVVAEGSPRLIAQIGQSQARHAHRGDHLAVVDVHHHRGAVEQVAGLGALGLRGRRVPVARDHQPHLRIVRHQGLNAGLQLHVQRQRHVPARGGRLGGFLPGVTLAHRAAAGAAQDRLHRQLHAPSADQVVGLIAAQVDLRGGRLHARRDLAVGQ